MFGQHKKNLTYYLFAACSGARISANPVFLYVFGVMFRENLGMNKLRTTQLKFITFVSFKGFLYNFLNFTRFLDIISLSFKCFRLSTIIKA